jgi:7-carboxy-7-deazaguanine synthase (Cx14CxxC type)
MTYSVKEIFYTLQGEGAHAGRPAVFCRFAGCNLWSGREEDRQAAQCQFCDTDFVGVDGHLGGKFADSVALAKQINTLWPDGHEHKYVVFTGGEPLLQVDAALIKVMHEYGFIVAIETNGTIAVPQGVDWVCVSPKEGTPLLVTRGNELKVVVPQVGQNLAQYETLDFEYFFVQPMDGKEQVKNTAFAIELCKANPRWHLSMQMHKIVQIP